MQHSRVPSFLNRRTLLLGLVMALCGGLGGSGSVSSAEIPSPPNPLASCTPAADTSWSALPDPFNSNHARKIWTLAVAPNGNVYAGGPGGVSVSSDGGKNWTVINTGLTNKLVTTLGFNALGEPMAGVGLKTTVPIDVLRYTQGNWRRAKGIAATRDIAAFTQDNSGALLAVTGWAGDVFRSTDNGNSFTKIAGTVGSPNGVTVGALFAVHNVPKDALYTGGEMVAGVYRSIDNGTTWLNDGLSKTQGYTGNITAMTHNALNEALVARTATPTGAPLQRRVKGEWVASSSGLPAWHTVFGLVLSPNHDLFVAVTGQAQTEGIYRSTDNGQTWKLDFSCTPYRARGNMAVDQAGSVYVFAKPPGSTGVYSIYKR